MVNTKQTNLFGRFEEVVEPDALAMFDQQDKKMLRLLHSLYIAFRTEKEEMTTTKRHWAKEHQRIRDESGVDNIITSNPNRYYSSREKGYEDELREQLHEITETFTGDCVEYLQRRHGINIPRENISVERILSKTSWGPKTYSGEVITLEELSARIKVALNGRDFAEQYTAETTAAFHKWGQWFTTSVKGTTVLFEKKTKPYSAGDYSINIADIKVLVRAISLSMGSPYALQGEPYHHGTEVNWNAAFLSPKEVVVTDAACELESIRRLKNGRVDVVFRTLKAAIAFCSYFGLHTSPN